MIDGTVWGYEQALISRYRFDESVLIGSDDSELLRKAIKLGAIVFVVAALLITYMVSSGTMGFLGGIAAGVGLAELSRVRMERDILKNCPGLGPPVRGRNGSWYGGGRRVAADSLLVA